DEHRGEDLRRREHLTFGAEGDGAEREAVARDGDAQPTRSARAAVFADRDAVLVAEDDGRLEVTPNRRGEIVARRRVLPNACETVGGKRAHALDLARPPRLAAPRDVEDGNRRAQREEDHRAEVDEDPAVQPEPDEVRDGVQLEAHRRTTRSRA